MQAQPSADGSSHGTSPPRPAPCYRCDGTLFWYNAGGQPICQKCHPQPSTAKETP
jgi:hypothetical protein